MYTRTLLVLALAMLKSQITVSGAASPAYVLVEEHHHVAPILAQLGHEGAVPLGATLLHVDSHHDMGLSPWLPSERPGTEKENEFEGRHSSPGDNVRPHEPAAWPGRNVLR
jgi:hypothetical protein